MSYSTVLPTYGWAYSPFGGGGGVSASVTYPQNILDIQNDIKLMNFNNNVDSLVAMAAALNASSTNASTNLYSNVAQSWQNMMANLAKAASNLNLGNTSGITINPFVPRTPTTPVTPGNGTTVEDSELLELINKMMIDDNDTPNLKDNLDGKIDPNNEDDDAERYGSLLLQLVSKYINADIDGENLTPAELAQIKTILASYKENESLTSAQLGQLKQIVKAHYTAEEAAEEANRAEERQRDSKYEAGHANTTTIDNAVEHYTNGLADGTHIDSLKEGNKCLNEYNVIEILDAFAEHASDLGENNTNLIKSINSDCNGWGTGNDWWDHRDDAKPFIKDIENALRTRAEHLIRKFENDSEFADLIEQLKECNEAQYSVDTGKYNSTEKASVSKTLNNLANAIRALEMAAYGDVEYSSTETTVIS